MESVLACLLLRSRHEQQARHPILSRPDLELVRGVAHDNPAQGLGPPSTKRDRIMSVDDDLLPNEIHVAHSAGRSQSGPASGRLAGRIFYDLRRSPALVAGLPSQALGLMLRLIEAGLPAALGRRAAVLPAPLRLLHQLLGGPLDTTPGVLLPA
jgi:hypothetical protein